MERNSKQPTPSAGRPGNQPSIRGRLDSRELFGAGREVIINHAGEEYRLRLTSQGKLILTK